MNNFNIYFLAVFILQIVNRSASDYISTSKLLDERAYLFKKLLKNLQLTMAQDIRNKESYEKLAGKPRNIYAQGNEKDEDTSEEKSSVIYKPEPESSENSISSSEESFETNHKDKLNLTDKYLFFLNNYTLSNDESLEKDRVTNKGNEENSIRKALDDLNKALVRYYYRNSKEPKYYKSGVNGYFKLYCNEEECEYKIGENYNGNNDIDNDKKYIKYSGSSEDDLDEQLNDLEDALIKDFISKQQRCDHNGCEKNDVAIIHNLRCTGNHCKKASAIENLLNHLENELAKETQKHELTCKGKHCGYLKSNEHERDRENVYCRFHRCEKSQYSSENELYEILDMIYKLRCRRNRCKSELWQTASDYNKVSHKIHENDHLDDTKKRKHKRQNKKTDTYKKHELKNEQDEKLLQLLLNDFKDALDREVNGCEGKDCQSNNQKHKRYFVNDNKNIQRQSYNIKAHHLEELLTTIKNHLGQKLLWFIKDPKINDIDNLNLNKNVEMRIVELKEKYQKSPINDDVLMKLVMREIKEVNGHEVKVHKRNDNAILVPQSMYDELVHTYGATTILDEDDDD